MTLASLFLRSQDVLPKERHRPSNPAARSWLQAEIRKAGPLPSVANVWKAPAANVATVAEAPSGTDAKAPERAATSAEAGYLPQSRSALVTALVDLGVEVFAGILSDPRVRAAVRRVVQPGSDESAAPSEPAPDNGSDAARNLVVVAGCSPEEARSLEKEFKGTLPLTFWGADEPRERLLELLPKAELVIGVADALPAPVDSSLSRLGSRYVRHKGSMQALYRRLAEHALQ